MKTLFLTACILFVSIEGFAQDQVLSRSEAEARALAHSPTLDSARSRVAQAEAQWRQLRGQSLPGIFLGASGTRIDWSDRAQAQLPGREDTAEQFSSQVDASWLLFNGGQRRNELRGARNRWEASEALAEGTRRQLVAAVGRGYHAAQLARVEIRITESDLAFNERQFEDARVRRKAGQGSRADVLNFEIRTNNAASQLAQARSTFEATRSSLEALLGHDAPGRILPQELALPGLQPILPEFDDSWTHARTNLTALQAQRKLVDASRAQLEAAKGEYWPELRAVGGVNAERVDDPRFEGSDVGSSVGVTLRYPLFDGGARKNRIREATAVLQEQEAALVQQELDAKAELRSAIANLDAAMKKRELGEETLKLTEENRELIEKAYRAGRESLLRLNEAQRDFVTAQSRLALNAIQVETAWIRVQQAMGDL